LVIIYKQSKILFQHSIVDNNCNYIKQDYTNMKKPSEFIFENEIDLNKGLLITLLGNLMLISLGVGKLNLIVPKPIIDAK